MTRKEKEKFLTERGWHTWYHPEYWVHQKVVAKREAQDYTDYGMKLDAAYLFETENLRPIPPVRERLDKLIEMIRRA